MIEWFTTVQIAVAVIVGITAIVLGALRRKPDDFTILPAAAVTLLLVAQIIVAIVAPFVGNAPTGDPVEFWIYLVMALLIPPLAIVWALIDRSRWATIILGVASLTVAIMVYRMGQIWFVQIA